MPKMDGITATNLIKEFRPDLPIIAVTAVSMGHDRQQMLDAGFTDFLSKPVSQKELMQMIGKYS